MFCPECGSQMPNDARFCGECGHSITPAAASEPASSAQAAQVVDLAAAPVQTVPDALKYGIVAGSVVIPLIGIIMGLIYMLNGETSEKKSVGRLWLFSGVGLGVLWVIVGGSGY